MVPFVGAQVRARADGSDLLTLLFEAVPPRTACDLLQAILAIEEMAQRAYLYGRIALAYAAAEAAGVAFNVDLDTIRYATDSFAHPRLLPQKGHCIFTAATHAEVSRSSMHNGLQSFDTEEGTVYTNLLNVAAALLAFEFCHFEKCDREEYDLVAFDFLPLHTDHSYFFRDRWDAELQPLSHAYGDKLERFGQKSRLLLFLPEYVERGATPIGQFEPLTSGLGEFAKSARTKI